jgi:diguanylate cyclase (GGDEF)-like protein
VRERTGVGVMIVDLHHFKEVNETLGHEHGDTLLQEVGRRLQGCSGPPTRSRGWAATSSAS